MFKNRVPTPPGNSWNIFEKFPGPGKSWKIISVLETAENLSKGSGKCWNLRGCRCIDSDVDEKILTSAHL